MSAGNITAECPICGDKLAIENFQYADVWKDNKKQCLFVCRHCANKKSRRSRWQRPLDVFNESKRSGDAE